MKLQHWMLGRLHVYPLRIPRSKDFGYHEGKFCFVLKMPHFGSHVGSGKISRRVYLEIRGIKPPASNESRHARRTKLLRQQEELIKQSNSKPHTQKYLSDGKPKFPNASVKILFNYWNNIGHPFVRHRQQRSKSLSQIFTNLNRIIKKYEQRQIVDAISVGKRLFDDKSFVYYKAFDRNKIGFHTFLLSNVKTQRTHNSWESVKRVRKQHGISMPISWFDECLKGWKYLEKTYCKIFELKDDYPDMTKKAFSMMEKHRLRNVNEKGRQDIVRFVRMLHNYCAMNKMDPLWLFDRIQDALNSFHTIKIDKTHYLTSMVFWSDTLPNELIRFDKRWFERRELICDKEKLLK